MAHLPHRRARRTAVATVVALALLCSAAEAYETSVPPPTGTAPLRFRDELFGTVAKATNLVYGSAPDARGTPVALKLDLYQPVGDAARRRPAVIWVHGGGFRTGNKGNPRMVEAATRFAKRGYVAASIDYRLLQGATCGSGAPPDCLVAAFAGQHDAQAAVRWLRANAARYRIDPSRIAIGGTSAGGVTADLVATRANDPGASGNPGPSSAVQAAVSISGGFPTTAFIGPGDAPLLLFHGTADRTVPFRWSVSNAAALDAAGVPSVLELLPGAGHVPWAAYGDLFVTQSANFLYRELALAPLTTLGRTAKASGTRARLKLRCRGPGACSGTVRLQSRRDPDSAVVYAAAKFWIADGQSERVSLKLRSAGRMLLESDRRVLVWATVTSRETQVAARKVRLYA
jgi:acetyl esterase/lipase